MRYVQILSELVDIHMPQRKKEISPEEKMILNQQDALINHRSSNVPNLSEQGTGELNQLHPLIKRKFTLNIIQENPSKGKKASNKIRELKSNLIGGLVSVKAMVTRVSEVRPLMQVAVLFCEVCGAENYQSVMGKQYTPIVECTSEKCRLNKNKGKLILNTGTSKFISYQEIKIQETNDQTPQGNVPRMTTIICKGSNVRTCTPGDQILVQGVLLPKEYENKFGSSTMLMDTYIEAFNITQLKKKYVEIELSQEVEAEIQQLRFKNQNNFEKIYNTLSRSICPEVWGMEDVKKALLLLMVGGVTLTKSDGMHIRGDLNVALIGDPGIAKSQLLKHISRISPRGIYTTGKGSSGVGLTASVLKDAISGEITLEAGALVLADKGVCCIDEFDKMNESDRTSIHEVMEQQTVSIAKAGITTTLNARTSILAAANPLFGRYNKNISPHKNVNLPPALLSRFDLIFILLDETDKHNDDLLAKHIGMVHKNLRSQTVNDGVSLEVLKGYIAKAKSYEPTFPQDLHQHLIDIYVDKRKNQKEYRDGQSYITPRTLLGIIRLSQAFAKLDFRNQVEKIDIEEALRLMEVSFENVNKQKESKRKDEKLDATTDGWTLVKDLCRYKKDRLETYDNLLEKFVNKGKSKLDLDTVLKTYQNLGLVMYNKNNGQVQIEV